MRNYSQSTIDSLTRSVLVARLPGGTSVIHEDVLLVVQVAQRVDKRKLRSRGYKFTDTTKKRTIVRTVLFKRSLTNVEDPLISRIHIYVYVCIIYPYI